MSEEKVVFDLLNFGIRTVHEFFQTTEKIIIEPLILALQSRGDADEVAKDMVKQLRGKNCNILTFNNLSKEEREAFLHYCNTSDVLITDVPGSEGKSFVFTKEDTAKVMSFRDKILTKEYLADDSLYKENEKAMRRIKNDAKRRIEEARAHGEVTAAELQLLSYDRKESIHAVYTDKISLGYMKRQLDSARIPYYAVGNNTAAGGKHLLVYLDGDEPVVKAFEENTDIMLDPNTLSGQVARNNFKKQEEYKTKLNNELTDSKSDVFKKEGVIVDAQDPSHAIIINKNGIIELNNNYFMTYTKTDAKNIQNALVNIKEPVMLDSEHEKEFFEKYKQYHFLQKIESNVCDLKNEALNKTLNKEEIQKVLGANKKLNKELSTEDLQKLDNGSMIIDKNNPTSFILAGKEDVIRVTKDGAFIYNKSDINGVKLAYNSIKEPSVMKYKTEHEDFCKAYKEMSDVERKDSLLEVVNDKKESYRNQEIDNDKRKTLIQEEKEINGLVTPLSKEQAEKCKKEYKQKLESIKSNLEHNVPQSQSTNIYNELESVTAYEIKENEIFEESQDIHNLDSGAEVDIIDEGAVESLGRSDEVQDRQKERIKKAEEIPNWTEDHTYRHDQEVQFENIENNELERERYERELQQEQEDKDRAERQQREEYNSTDEIADENQDEKDLDDAMEAFADDIE